MEPKKFEKPFSDKTKRHHDPFELVHHEDHHYIPPSVGVGDKSPESPYVQLEAIY